MFHKGKCIVKKRKIKYKALWTKMAIHSFYFPVLASSYVVVVGM